MKKNILYIDYLSPKGHLRWNKLQIQTLLELGMTVRCVFKDGYIDEMGLDESFSLFSIPQKYYKREGTFLSRYNYLRILKYLKKRIIEPEWDMIILSSFETISLSIKPVFKDAYIFNHNTIVDLDSSIKKWFFFNLPKQYTHLVYTENLKTKLITSGIRKEKVRVIPHGFLKISTNRNNAILKCFNLKEGKYLFVNVSQITNKDVISTVINDVNFLNFITINNMKCVVKGEVDTQIKSNNICFIKDYLDETDYYSILEKSFGVLICYDKEFKYRNSGVLFECMMLDKPAFIYYNDSLFEFDKYSTSGSMFFSNVKELLEIMNKKLKNYQNNYYNLSEIQTPLKGWEKLINNN